MLKRDEKAIQAARKSYCEYCGRCAEGEPHHIFTRGAGGRDIKENLIELCFDCHRAAHDGHIRRDALLGLVAKREGKTYDEIYAINRRAMGWPV